MSHVVQIKTTIRDPAGVAAACHRLGLAAPVHRTAELRDASGRQVEGSGGRRSG